MAPTDGRFARPERRWDCRRGTPLWEPSLVTRYYCRLGDMLCFVFMSAYCMFDLSVYYLFLQYFDTVGWVCDLWKPSPI